VDFKKFGVTETYFKMITQKVYFMPLHCMLFVLKDSFLAEQMKTLIKLIQNHWRRFMNFKQCKNCVSFQATRRVFFRSLISVLLQCVCQYILTFRNNILPTSSTLLNLVLVKVAAIQEVKNFGFFSKIAILEA